MKKLKEMMVTGGIRTALACLAILLAALSLGVACATSSSEAEPSAETNHLMDLLQVIPSDARGDVLFSDLRMLSTYEGAVVPNRGASPADKTAWWASIQGRVLYGIPYPTATDIWGFDATDIEGLLTFLGTPIITVLTGDLDTDALLSKFRQYGYAESQYRGMTVFTWTLQVTSEVTEQLPRAIGVIHDASPSPLIVMAGSASAGTGATEAQVGVEASIETYLEGTAIANGSRYGIPYIADSFGKVGSAYLTENPAFEERWRSLDSQQRARVRASIGSGRLNLYSELEPVIGIAYRAESGVGTLEFVLGLTSPGVPESSRPVMERRLAEGRSLHLDQPLSALFTVAEMRTNGPYLHATVELTGEASQESGFFTTLIFNRDYWYLMPTQH